MKVTISKAAPTLIAFAAILFAAGVQAATDELEKCGVIAGREGEQPLFQLVPGLSVLQQTNAGSFSVVAPLGQKIGAIMCGRADIIPALNDYMVLLAGYPLFITSGDGTVMVILEIVNGRLQIRTKGVTDTALLERIQTRVNEMQIAMQAHQ